VIPDLSGLTLAERILSVKAGRRSPAGSIVVIPVDQVMVVDSIAPAVFEMINRDLDGAISDPARISVVIDHVAPASSVQVATAQKGVRDFARKHGLRLFDIGRGICHQIMFEEGLARPGWVVLGSDSHSTTYGAVCAFGTGMGASDIALAASTGRTWLRVPKTFKIQFRGVRPPGVSAKDVALAVVAKLGANGATYGSIEFHGAQLFSMSERLTLANMAVEAGAKVGLVVPDALTRTLFEVPAWLESDPQAWYTEEIAIDLNRLEPTVAAPAHVDNVHPVNAHLGVYVDQVFVGTCTNGRLDDLHEVATVLRGKRIAASTRLLIIPASSKVFEEAVADGTVSTLLAAGATFGTPGCGPCMGRHMGVLAPGEVCVSTGNRNFVGRMGSPDAKVFLASPAVAAATALAGRLTSPENLPSQGLSRHGGA
jgi:methanogen homoaconitase large subunit